MVHHLEKGENSRSEEPVVVVILRTSCNECDVAAGIGTDCLNKGVYGVKERVSSPMDVKMS